MVGHAHPTRLRGWERREVLELFRFLDWLLRLPEIEENRLWSEIQQLEEQRVMQYVTSVERIGMNKGLQQGETRLLRRLLTRKFGSIPDWVETRLAAATPDQLENWSERILDAPTLGAIFADA